MVSFKKGLQVIHTVPSSMLEGELCPQFNVGG